MQEEITRHWDFLRATESPLPYLLFSSSGELFLTLPTSVLTSKASISSSGKGRSRSTGGRDGSESRSSQRSKPPGWRNPALCPASRLPRRPTVNIALEQ